jgi:lambda repressor-like predicted transcriptional regulator
MTHKEIRKRLIDLEVSQAEIARRNRVTRASVNHVIMGRIVSRRLRRAIARTLGVPVKEIWPQKQDAA